LRRFKKRALSQEPDGIGSLEALQEAWRGVIDPAINE
jgi:hypothetical protein